MLKTFVVAKHASLYVCTLAIPAAIVKYVPPVRHAVVRHLMDHPKPHPKPMTSGLLTRHTPNMSDLTPAPITNEIPCISVGPVQAGYLPSFGANEFGPSGYAGGPGGPGYGPFNPGAAGPGGYGVPISTPSVPLTPYPPSQPSGPPTGPTSPTAPLPDVHTWIALTLGLGTVGAALRINRRKRIQADA